MLGNFSLAWMPCFPVFARLRPVDLGYVRMRRACVSTSASASLAAVVPRWLASQPASATHVQARQFHPFPTTGEERGAPDQKRPPRPSSRKGSSSLVAYLVGSRSTVAGIPKLPTLAGTGKTPTWLFLSDRRKSLKSRERMIQHVKWRRRGGHQMGG